MKNLNIRRRYSRLSIKQFGTPSPATELTDYFTVGPNPIPVFGMATEVTIPWDDDYDNAIVVDFSVLVDQNLALNRNDPQFAGYASISVVGFQLN